MLRSRRLRRPTRSEAPPGVIMSSQPRRVAAFEAARLRLGAQRDRRLLEDGGIARGFGDAPLRFDVGGLGRAFATAVDLACAVAGFVIGKLGRALEKARVATVLKDQPTQADSRSAALSIPH